MRPSVVPEEVEDILRGLVADAKINPDNRASIDARGVATLVGGFNTIVQHGLILDKLVRDLVGIQNGAADGSNQIAAKAGLAIRKLYEGEVGDSCEHCPDREDCQTGKEKQAAVKN